MGGGGVHQPISPDSQLFKSFPTEAAQNDPQWPILSLKWLRLTQNGQFWLICNFSHLFPPKVAQIDSEWSILADSQLFQSYSTKVVGFSQKFKIFVPGGGGKSDNFPRFATFPIFSQLSSSNSLAMANFAQLATLSL